MAKTKIQFRKQVLWNLGALAAGQAPHTEDIERVDEGAVTALAWLEKTGLYQGVFEYQNDDIQDAAYMPLARFVANEIGSVYGVPYSMDVKAMAERDLYRAYATGPTYARLQVDYF